MSAHTIYDCASLGSVIRYSDGTRSRRSASEKTVCLGEPQRHRPTGQERAAAVAGHLQLAGLFHPA